jgi:hypothetical protein
METNSSSRNYRVKQIDGHYYVMGLKSAFAEEGSEAKSLLLSYSEYGEPDSPHDHESMRSALYREFQVNDNLHAGDTFRTPYGNFLCMGVSVVPDGPAKRGPVEGIRLHRVYSGYYTSPDVKSLKLYRVIESDQWTLEYEVFIGKETRKFDSYREVKGYLNRSTYLRGS